jgi:hypothetical protein
MNIDRMIANFLCLADAVGAPRSVLPAIERIAALIPPPAEKARLLLSILEQAAARAPDNLLQLSESEAAAARTALSTLRQEQYFGRRFGLDYELQLWATQMLAREDTAPTLYRYLLADGLPDSNELTPREGSLEHLFIRYARLGSQRVPTSLILTYDPNESATHTPILYCSTDFYGAAASISCERFNRQRRLAVYDTARSFLLEISKSLFRPRLPSDTPLSLA